MRYGLPHVSTAGERTSHEKHEGHEKHEKENRFSIFNIILLWFS